MPEAINFVDGRRQKMSAVSPFSHLTCNIFILKGASIINHDTDIGVGRQFVEFINGLVPVELDMSISTAWHNINGQMKNHPNEDFFLLDLFSSPFFNNDKCWLESNFSSNCQKIKVAIMWLYTIFCLIHEFCCNGLHGVTWRYMVIWYCCQQL
jgi:hypothetical protein